MHDAAWDTIADLVTWLDKASHLPTETEQLLRIMKIGEEFGEVNEAVAGALGQNPRKGKHKTQDDVDDELCDVIMTAMVALRSRRPDAGQYFTKRLEYVTSRSRA